MNEQQSPEIMIRYLQNACSSLEKTRFEAWLQASEENRQQFYEVRLLWYSSRIEHFGSKDQLDKALLTFTDNVLHSRMQRRQKLRLRIARYAAIIMVAGAISWIFLTGRNPKTDPIEWVTASVAHTDSSKLVVLNDSTLVWLNGNSKITYPRSFSQKERTVTLEGEAFFDVRPDPHRPFVIHTATIGIKVLGTAFNLQAYPSDNYTEAVLVHGKIAVSDSLGQDLVTIIPGQMARFEKSNHSLTVKDVDSDAYTSWRRGEIRLMAVNLKTIARKLSDLYQVNFSIDPRLPDTTRYNFTFSKRSSVTEVMNMLRFIAPVEYTIHGKTVNITKK